MGEGTYQYQFGRGGKYDTPGVTGGPTASGTDMDYHNPTPINEWGGYRGIGLVEVICKMTTSIIKTLLMVDISLHDALHGFCQ